MELQLRQLLELQTPKNLTGVKGSDSKIRSPEWMTSLMWTVDRRLHLPIKCFFFYWGVSYFFTSYLFVRALLIKMLDFFCIHFASILNLLTCLLFIFMNFLKECLILVCQSLFICILLCNIFALDHIHIRANFQNTC